MVIQIKTLSTVEENCKASWFAHMKILITNFTLLWRKIFCRHITAWPRGANQVRSSFMYLLVQVCDFNMYTGKRIRTHQGVCMWIKMLRKICNCCAGLRDQHRKECIQRRSMRLVYRNRILPCKPFILQSVIVHCFFHNNQNTVNHLSKIQWCHTMRPLIIASLIMLCSAVR